MTYLPQGLHLWVKQNGKDRGSSMKQFLYPLLVAGIVGACSGTTGKDNPFQPDPEEETDTVDTPTEQAGIETTLARNVSQISRPGGDSITVQVASLDGTPLANTFVRNPALDTAGYLAYTTQEDALDRMFVALAAQSMDGSVHAGTVIDGGQFNIYHGGGYYERDGDFDPPDIGDGPGEGQVSYAGTYAGLTNVNTSEGANLIDIPAGIDPADLPDLPGEPYRVRGTIFLNANFADNAVNGEIYNRVLISPVDGSAEMRLDDLALIVTEIDANGEFFGNVEIDGNIGVDIGDYGGIFGGEDAQSVAGIVSISNFSDDLENEDEVGVFVLTQCGMPGDADVCDAVEPN